MFKIMLENNNQIITSAFIDALDNNCMYKITDKDPDVFISIRKNTNTEIYCNDINIRNGCSSYASLIRFMIKVHTFTKEQEKLITAKVESLQCPIIMLVGDENKMRASVIADYLCHILFTHFSIDSLMDDVVLRGPNDIDTAKEVIKLNYTLVKDVNGRMTANKLRDVDVVDKNTIERSKGSRMYFVRRRYHDTSSEKLYTENLQQAVTECNKYVGYHVYDDTGRTIYSSPKGKLDASKVTKDTKTNRSIIRTGNGIRVRNEKGKFVDIPDGTYATIVKTIGDKSEIRIIHDKKAYTTMIRNDYLKDL